MTDENNEVGIFMSQFHWWESWKITYLCEVTKPSKAVIQPNSCLILKLPYYLLVMLFQTHLYINYILK